MDIHLSLPGSAVLAIYAELNLSTANPSDAVAYAPDFSEVRAWFERIWSDVVNAMADFCESGQDKVAEWMPRINAKLDEARRELGERMDRLVALLQENLVKGARHTQSALLALLPMSLTIAAGAAPLRELTVQYQLTVSSDISIGIAFALKMAAGSTVTVAAKYALP
jgi:hypothetical protein